MKIIKKLCLCCVCIFVLYGCKKDYPDDIPVWLKMKIREYKKEEGQELSKISILEVAFNGENMFAFIRGGSDSWGIYNLSIKYYDYDGNYICRESYYEVGHSHNNECKNFSFITYGNYNNPYPMCQWIRKIWRLD